MPNQSPVPYKRILLKLSGEILVGEQSFGVDPKACDYFASIIDKMQKEGFELSIVIGGGNIFRGRQLQALGMEKTPSDQIGMLATMMNALVLEQYLKKQGCKAKILTSLDCPKVAESFRWDLAQKYLKEGYVLIFAGGTGNPYFTTDTAAALKASEVQADILLKATKVDGIYNLDPLKYKEAIKYDSLTYSDYLTQKLEVMDATAISICRNQKLPIMVFNMNALGKFTLKQIVLGECPSSIIKAD
ncbi:Uridylate kinase [Candidatus Rubidus massiliensis]|nr:Uridylate kinase [Candidatus Rubidus massiliensis]